MALYIWQVNELELPLAIVGVGTGHSSRHGYFPALSPEPPGIRRHFSTLLRPRGSFIWYLVALFAFPAIQLLGAGITWLLAGEVEVRLDGMSLVSAAIFLAFTFLNGFLSAGGTNDERGWRDFALPRLQGQYPVMVAVGIVWFFWALWHLTYDIGSETPIDSLLRNRIFHSFLWSIYFAWVYNRTRGSILAPALFHPSMNTFGDHLGRMLQLPDTPITMYLSVSLAIFPFLYDPMWKKLPPDDPAVFGSA
jgi:membrane protease YdiL (CAAX protease family)